MENQSENYINVSQAVILAGGRGERLSPLTNTIPKPLAPINKTPFMDYLIYTLVKKGINKVLILLGYKGSLIADRYKSMQNVVIEFSYGNEEDKTGRRILNAYKQLDNHFLLMYGDNYWPIELEQMLINYQNLKTTVTTTVFSNKNGTGEYGYGNNIVVADDNMVVKYDKEMQTEFANGVDIGYFLVSKKALNPKLKSNLSFELDILPSLIINKELGAFMTDSQYYYITNKKSLKAFQNVVKENSFSPLPKKYWR